MAPWGGIWGNDTLDLAIFDPADVTTTVVDEGGLTGVVIGPDGAVTVPAGSAPGQYAVTYQICSTADPTECSSAAITLVLTAAAVAAAALPTTGVEISWRIYAGAGVLLVAGVLLTVATTRRRFARRIDQRQV